MVRATAAGAYRLGASGRRCFGGIRFLHSIRCQLGLVVRLSLFNTGFCGHACNIICDRGTAHRYPYPHISCRHQHATWEGVLQFRREHWSGCIRILLHFRTMLGLKHWSKVRLMSTVRKARGLSCRKLHTLRPDGSLANVAQKMMMSGWKLQSRRRLC